MWISHNNYYSSITVWIFSSGDTGTKRPLAFGLCSACANNSDERFGDLADRVQVLVCGLSALSRTCTSDPFIRTHRKVVKHVQNQSRVLNVLFLMVESGVVYALLQVNWVLCSF